MMKSGKSCNNAFKALLIFLSLGLMTSSALAQQRPLWELGLGLAGLHLPYYRGSNQERGYLLPFPYIIYRGDFFQVDEDGLQGLLYRSPDVVVDLSLAGGVPVPSNKDGARQGMPNLAPTVEFGPSLEFRLWNKENHYHDSLWLRMPLRATYSVDGLHWGHEGWIFAPYLEYSKKPLQAKDMEYNLAIGPIFSDADYHDYFYGVDPAYATPSRPAYKGRGGYSGSRITLTTQKTIGNLTLSAFLRLDNLNGAAFIDSPLVERRSYHIAGFAMIWILGRSETLVYSP
jgi:outer membrane protein